MEPGRDRPALPNNRMPKSAARLPSGVVALPQFALGDRVLVQSGNKEAKMHGRGLERPPKARDSGPIKRRNRLTFAIAKFEDRFDYIRLLRPAGIAATMNSAGTR
jgi:hypothetical protein